MSDTALTSPLDSQEGSDSRTLHNVREVKTHVLQQLTELESERVKHYEPLVAQNSTYWDRFQAEMTFGYGKIVQLQQFLLKRLEADQVYVEAIRTSSQPSVSKPVQEALSSQSPFSTFQDAFESLTRSQEQFADKLDQFIASIRKDVLHRYITEFSVQYKSAIDRITQKGSSLHEDLNRTHVIVCESFHSLQSILNCPLDGWRLELTYFISVQKWQSSRCEYVKGMAECFNEFKTLEINRIAVLQKALEAYLRKQRLFFEQMAHAISEPMTAAERVHPEKDLLQTIRRIPKNETAAAVQMELDPGSLSIPSPLQSPLLQKIGLLRFQLTGSLYNSWKSVVGVITLDRYFHLFDINGVIESTNWLPFLSHATQNISIALANCRIEIGRNPTENVEQGAIFQVIETTDATSYFHLFREAQKRFIFQCRTQEEMIAWVVALDALETQ